MISIVRKNSIPALWESLKSLAAPPEIIPDEVLLYWREKILSATLVSGVLLGVLAYIPSVRLAFKEGLWWVIFLDTGVYLCALCILIMRKIPFIVRAISLLAIFYALGLLFLIFFGLFAGGPVWLFAFPVMTGVLLGLRPAIIALSINVLSIVFTGFLVNKGFVVWPQTYTHGTDGWLMIVTNFIFLSAIASVSLAVLVESLKASVEKEKAVSAKMEEDQRLLVDINEQLRFQVEKRKQLEAEATRFGSLLESSLNEIYLFDADSLKFIHVNKGARENLGYTMEELHNMTPIDIKPEFTMDSFFDLVKPLRSGERELISLSTVHQRKNKSIYPIDMRLQLMEFEDISIFVAFVLDVTDRKEAEQEKRKLESRLQQAHKMEAIGTLAGGIAHDFNNILSAIIGYTELSKLKMTDDDEILSYLEEIDKAGSRAKDLVKQILTFSRQTEQEVRPVKPKIIIKETLKLIRASLPSTIQIHDDIKSDSLIMGDATKIHQVLMNLFTNAGHAMTENGGILEVLLDDVEIDQLYANTHPNLRPGSYIKLTVSDNGCGMTKEIMDRIFDPFFTTKEKGEGSGMGLSVVHGIIKSHGGSIHVYSEPQKGTTFNIFLPVIDMISGQKKSEKKSIPRGSERILLVDDEEVLVNLGRQSLENLGYHVTTRSSSLEALYLFREKPMDFDVVITDLTMPDLTGDKLAMKLLEIRKDIPIILCTGFSEKMNKELARKIGIRAFLQKPFIRSEIAEALRSAIEG